MVLIVLGALCVIVGVAMAAVRTAGQGRLSQPSPPTSGQPNTLEPPGQGRRLSVKADLFGLGMAAMGAVLLLAGVLLNAAKVS